MARPRSRARNLGAGAGAQHRARFVARVLSLLERRYDTPRHGNLHDVFWETAYVLLSIRTTEAAYQSVFRQLRRAYPAMSDLATASIQSLRRIITPLGLSKKRSAQLRAIARTLGERFGSQRSVTRFGKDRPTELEELLQTFPGVGLKIAKCVTMYACDAPVLPVDVHVWRVATRLGLAPGGRLVDRKALDLERAIAPRFRYDFHVRAMALGRDTCKSKPECLRCVLKTTCPSSTSPYSR